MSQKQPPPPVGPVGPLSKTPIDVINRSTFLTVAEAADFVRSPTVAAFRQWAYRACLPKSRRGRTVLYRRRELEAAVRPSHLPPPKKNEP
jgi:hypothetical protein